MANASIESYKIPPDAFNELLDNNYIRYTEDPNKITLTAKGIWYVEFRQEIISLEKLVDFVDDKIFNKFEKIKGLNEREKMIVLSLLATRAFSPESSADMKKEDRIKDRWYDVLIKTYDFLKECGLISKLNKNDLKKDEYIEHPASNILRHNVDLPKKTFRIYISKGENRYYLDVSKDKNIIPERIATLFKLIFEDKLVYENLDKITDFCNKMAYDNAAYLFDMDTHIFATPSNDDIIIDALKSVIH